MVARLSDQRTTGMPEPLPPPVLVVWRCPSCRQFLARMALAPGSTVEIKCPRCGVLAVKEVG